MVSVRSRVGQIELDAQVTDRIEPGHVFTAFHFPEVRTNLLVGAVGRRQHVAARSTRSSPSTCGPIAEQPAFTPVVSGVA